jgi:hypothetical protein
MTGRRFRIILFATPAIVASIVCFVIIPVIGVIRNVILYNYFSFSSYPADALALLLYGWAPVYGITLPITALALYLYFKLGKKTLKSDKINPREK